MIHISISRKRAKTKYGDNEKIQRQMASVPIISKKAKIFSNSSSEANLSKSWLGKFPTWISDHN